MARKYVVGKAGDIPDGGRVIVELGGHSVGVFNVGGRFSALLNRCPHAGAPLCRGSMVGHLQSDVPGSYQYDASRKLLQCPWHGWEFDVVTGQSYFDPERTRVRAYPAAVHGGGELARAIDAGETEDPAASEAIAGEIEPRPYGVPLEKGPYTAEVLPVAVENDYVVVSLGRLGG